MMHSRSTKREQYDKLITLLEETKTQLRKPHRVGVCSALFDAAVAIEASAYGAYWNLADKMVNHIANTLDVHTWLAEWYEARTGRYLSSESSTLLNLRLRWVDQMIRQAKRERNAL